jgi:hypothetical protein
MRCGKPWDDCHARLQSAELERNAATKRCDQLEDVLDERNEAYDVLGRIRSIVKADDKRGFQSIIDSARKMSKALALLRRSQHDGCTEDWEVARDEFLEEVGE